MSRDLSLIRDKSRDHCVSQSDARFRVTANRAFLGYITALLTDYVISNRTVYILRQEALLNSTFILFVPDELRLGFVRYSRLTLVFSFQIKLKVYRFVSLRVVSTVFHHK